jgi:starch synthase
MAEKKRPAPKPKTPVSSSQAPEKKISAAKKSAAPKIPQKAPLKSAVPEAAVPELAVPPKPVVPATLAPAAPAKVASKAPAKAAVKPPAKAQAPAEAPTKAAAPKPPPRKAVSKKPEGLRGVRRQADARASAPLNILMVASEAHPYAHTGGLAEVVAALPEALGRLGHRVTLIIPRYRGVEVAGAHAERTAMRLGAHIVDVTFYTGITRAGVTPVFVDVPELFDRDGLYGSDGRDFPDNAWRFAVFSRAALEYARRRGERPTIIHAHDWQTGMVPVFQKMQFSNDPVIGGVPVIFTVHNLAFQGVFSSATLPDVGLGWEVMDVQALEYWGQISYVKGGINFSERLTTVSPSYAREILTPEHGCGLDGALRRRADELTGIVNAIDTARWNPEHDDLVGASFTANDLSGKGKAKQILLETVGLPVDAAALARPVIGLISRLTNQKGLDLLAAATSELMSLDATWVMLGSGDHEYEALWRALEARHPDRVSTTIGFEERLAHRIEAGADMFLMPSRYEPCGLNQLYSHRYGTLPIVHATGGLEDTVRDVTERDPNGFKFREFTPAGLLDVLQRALQLFRNPNEWKKMQQAGMNDDYSWDVSAREYVKVYEEAARAAAMRSETEAP